MRKFKLGTKLYLSFGLLVLILALVGGISFVSLNQVVQSGGQSLAAGANNMIVNQNEYELLRWMGAVKDLFLNNQAAIKATTNPQDSSLGKLINGEQAKLISRGDPSLARLLDEIKEPHQKLFESAASIQKKWNPNHPGLSMTLAARFADHRRWAGSLVDSLLMQKDITVELDPAKCSLGKWLASGQAAQLRKKWPQFDKLMAQLEAHHNMLHAGAKDIKSLQWPDVQIQMYVQKTIPELNAIAGLFDKAQAMEQQLDSAQAEAKSIFTSQTMPAFAATSAKLEQVTKHLSQAQEEAKTSMKTVAEWSQYATLLAAVLGILLGALMAFLATRNITKALARVVSGLNAGAEQVAAAASQVSYSSQSLAQGASEQAARLEETSASMEEMSSMTDQNADHANQADTLMHQAVKIVSKANSSMAQLKEAMAKINSASDETAKIIRTIDEIAFQTNLLALNAAVEAARAGEAGAGFAVVADEVRNLAMRAAEAAKNTSHLIEENIQDIKNGSELVGNTDQAFSQMEESAVKVAQLLDEIAAASREQTQGVEQINRATTEMDSVTQQVAAGAEESAASSEELAAQAATMQGLVAELVVLIEGGNGHGPAKRGLLAKEEIKALSLDGDVDLSDG
jgi:methyl-accepting chemotaxis protein